MNCQEALEFIEDAMDKQLSAGDKLKFDLHLARCQKCRSLYEAERAEHTRWFRAMNAAADEPPHPLPPDFADRLVSAVLAGGTASAPPRRRARLPRWAKMAACLALFLSFAVFAATVVVKRHTPTVTANSAEAPLDLEELHPDQTPQSVEESQMNIRQTLAATTSAAVLASPTLLLGNGGTVLRSDSKWVAGSNWSIGPSSKAWTNETTAGESVAWENGATAIINVLPWNVGIAGAFEMDGLVVDAQAASAKCFFDGAGIFATGAGGVQMRSGCVWFGINNAIPQPKFYLRANQTWSGSASATTTRIGVGCGYSNSGNSMLIPDVGVSAWTIEGKLEVWLYSPANDFSSVDVTVKSPAKLILPDKKGGRLRARRLTLDGSGELLPLGKNVGVADWNSYTPVTMAYVDEDHLAATLELKNGAGLSVVSPTALAVPMLVVSGESGARSEISGPFDCSGLGAISIASGTTLAFSGDVRCRAGISGSGTLEIDANGTSYFGTCNFSEFSGGITVASGTLELASMAALPNGVTVTTTGEGRLLLGSAAGYDESRLGGTKNAVVDTGIVTDVVRTESTITVGAGETLRIVGNGLTEATSLVLAGGRLVFEANGVTVASPVSITQPSWIETKSSAVTGTISGTVSAQIGAAVNNTNGVWAVGAGCVVFSGGGTFTSNMSSLYVDDGASVKLTNGNYIFEAANIITKAHGSAGQQGANWGRYIAIVDGGHVRITGVSRSAIQLAALLDGSNYNKLSMLEVGRDSSLYLDDGINIAIASDQAAGKLLVNGGTCRIGGIVLLGWMQMGTGIIDLRSGTLELCNGIKRQGVATASYQPQGRIDWSGGVLKIASNFPNSQRYLISNNSATEDEKKRLRIWVRITGVCTLDLTDVSANRPTPLENAPEGFDRAEWFGTGTLVVKGGKTFVMNSIGNGVSLKQEDDGTKVLLPENSQVFDYAICEANKEVIPYKDRYSTTNTVLVNLSIPSFVSAGDDTAISNGRPSRVVTIAEAVATAGGEFNNSTTLLGPGSFVVSNLVFQAGSILGATTGTAALDVIDTITLPNSLSYCVRRGPSSPKSEFVAFLAGGDLSGRPASWTRIGSGNYAPKVNAVVGTVSFFPAGTKIVFR